MTDRNALGQFTAGHRDLTHGNRRGYSRTHQLISRFRQSFTHDDIDAMAEKLKEMAMNGDIQAMKLIIDVLFPKHLLVSAIQRMDSRLEEEESIRTITNEQNGTPETFYPLSSPDNWVKTEDGWKCVSERI